MLAKVGGLSAFAGMLTRPGPAFVSMPFASWSATQVALQGILAALFERESSGRGQLVEADLAHSVGARPLGVDGALADPALPGRFHRCPAG